MTQICDLYKSIQLSNHIISYHTHNVCICLFFSNIFILEKCNLLVYLWHKQNYNKRLQQIKQQFKNAVLQAMAAKEKDLERLTPINPQPNNLLHQLFQRYTSIYTARTNTSHKVLYSKTRIQHPRRNIIFTQTLSPLKKTVLELLLDPQNSKTLPSYRPHNKRERKKCISQMPGWKCGP